MIRSTFAGFTAARLGLTASQSCLDITGQNISNINTEGYTRQRVDLISVNKGNGSDLYSSKNDNYIGYGVNVSGTSQIRDPFLDVRYRTEVASVGASDKKMEVLEDLQSILDEVGKDGSIQKQIAAFSTALNNLSSEVGNKEFDSIVKSSADMLTKLMNRYAKELETVRDNTEYGLTDIDVPSVNNILKSIQNLNVTIKNNQLHGNPSLELKDQRNLYIDQLAEYVKIDVKNLPTKIEGSSIYVDELKITLMGTNQNYMLVDDDKIAQFETAQTTKHGPIEFSLSPISSEITTPITKDVEDLNPLLQKIQDLSTQIRQGETNGDDVSGLKSDRNKQIDILKSYLNLEVIPGTTTNGAGSTIDNLTIKLLGKNDSYTLIEGNQTGTFSSTTNAQGKQTDSLVPAGETDAKTIQTSMTAQTDVPQINLILKQIAAANEEITNLTMDATTDPTLLAQKMTDRSDLVTQLGNYLDISETHTTQTLSNGSTVDLVSLSSHDVSLVEGTQCSTIASHEDATGKLRFEIHPFSQTINDELSDGSLKSSLDALNCNGEFDLDSTSPKGIGYYTKMLDTLAVKFASVFNEANQYTDTDGVLHECPLFSTTDGKDLCAKNITIHEDWVEGKYGIVATKNPDQKPVGANDNVIHLLAQITTKFDFNTQINGTDRSLFHGTFQECFTNIGSVLSLDYQSTSTSLDNHLSVTTDLSNAKDSVSGVSLDEEGINLIQYQKSYNAAARFMTTLDEALDTLLNMGVVGK